MPLFQVYPSTQVLSRRAFTQALLLGATGTAACMARGHSANLVAAAQPRSAARLQEAGRLFTLVTNRAPSDLDPHSAYDAGSGVVLQGLFEGLIRLRPGTADDYLPVLAESWEANADSSVWTFHLREGVTFHDGTPLDALAVRASFARLFALGLAPSTVLGRFMEGPENIAIMGPTTLTFNLGRSQPLFEAALASAYGTAIVNVAALQQHEVDGDWGHAWAQANSDGVGTGPYCIRDFDTETGVVLERNDDYWKGWEGNHFDQVTLRVVIEPQTRRALIETGEADVATTLPSAAVQEMQQNPALVVDHRYNLRVMYLAMTVAGPLQTAAARQALCWAFPYQEVIRGVYESMARQAIGPVAELCHGFDPATFRYQTDLERARSLLRQAGIDQGSTLTMALPPGNEAVIATAELFQANLAEIGLTLAIQTVDFATYVGMFFGDLPAAERPNLLPSFWQPDYNDAWNHLWPQIACDAWQAGNGGHYCNQRVDALLTQARDAKDSSSYQSALSEIQQIVTRDDPAAIYYAQPEWLTVLRADIGGYASDLVVGEIMDFYALYRR